MKLVDHLDKLHAYRTIIRAGTLQRAARELHLTQPSLTRLLKTLEQAAGVRLVSTGRNGVVPTAAGKRLLEYSVTVLKQLENLESKLRYPDDPSAGHLVIGTYDSLAEYLWPDFLKHFQKTAPAIKLSIQTRQTDQHLKALERSEIDVLVDAEPRVVGDYTSWGLYEDRFNFFVGKGLNRNFDRESALEWPLIYCPSAFDRDNKTIVQHLEENGFHSKQKIELDSFTSVKTFCQKGLGIAVLPTQLASGDLNHSLFNANLEGIPKRGFGTHDIAATVKSARSDDQSIKLFLKSLRTWLKEK